MSCWITIFSNSKYVYPSMDPLCGFACARISIVSYVDFEKNQGLHYSFRNNSTVVPLYSGSTLLWNVEFIL